MELIDQHTKSIMEGCKERAWDAGLTFEKETLEYIVTNRDLLELTPKVMIPTLYDYWVHDVEVLKEKGRYELYPHNPYETVINTRPAISFYNDNNPDWLNVMIFYHVLAHIDFFQNNLYFRHTWEYDFTGQALSDKRMIAMLRAEKGRWVDYVVEFSRAIDNLVGYFDELSSFFRPGGDGRMSMLDFYFDVFLQDVKNIRHSIYLKEIERYNNYNRESAVGGEQAFFADVFRKYPEFESMYLKYRDRSGRERQDILQFLMANSEFLNKDENRWMQSVMEVVRKTSIFFQPQIRTKIMNEGWASYWHERLFLSDDRISSHEVDFARVNAYVTSMPRVGLNPYALGMRLFYYIEEMGDKGRYSVKYDRLRDAEARRIYDAKSGNGRDLIFNIRENHSDYTFINTFIDQDFVVRHKLFVAGKRFNQQRMTWQYYVKSRNAQDYKEMVLENLFHPPAIIFERKDNNILYLKHRFENKPLVQEFIGSVLMGLEFLWGGEVRLETSEVVSAQPRQVQDSLNRPSAAPAGESEKLEIKWQRVVYAMKDRKLSKMKL